jgi:hypothetical protein
MIQCNTNVYGHKKTHGQVADREFKVKKFCFSLGLRSEPKSRRCMGFEIVRVQSSKLTSLNKLGLLKEIHNVAV